MRFVSGIGIRIAIVAVVVVGGFIFRDRLSGNAGDLRVGDCFDPPAGASETVEDVQHHPCTESHQAEVFLITDHPAAKGAALPSDSELDAFITGTCIGHLIAYAGSVENIPPNVDIGIFYPGDEDWANGEREVTCYAGTVDGSNLSASLRASK